MILNKRIPLNDLDALDRILNSDDWKIIIKYARQLHFLNEKKFFDKPVNSMLIYERGKVDGSKQLLKQLQDLKEYYKGQLESAE